ncbi:MAG: hypothetical protein H7250_06115 [Flavobacterium sp.]|nr:hypothetical protein [Flavobacterium sp.]
MKNTFFLTILLSAFLFSCSPGDSSANNSSAADYFPLKLSNYWTYNVDKAGTIDHDSIFVAKDTTINTFVYKKIESKIAPIGFMSNSLNNNELRIDGNKILLTGKPNLNFVTNIGINLSLSDFVIFKSGASANEILSSVSGTIDQVYNSYPITINYTLKSVAQGDLATYTSPNNATFNNVKAVNTILNIKVTTLLGPLPITVLEPQDVIVSTQYFAKNIGVVHANTVYNYNLSTGLGSNLGIPENGNQIINEFIDTYKVN